MGAKKNPFYRIIVIDSKEARNGAPTDTIGWYDPAKLDAPVKIDEEKTLSWLGKGANPNVFPFICAFTKHSLTSHLCSIVIAH